MRVGSTQFEAFDKAKKLLTLAELLASYDTAKPLCLVMHHHTEWYLHYPIKHLEIIDL